MIYALAPAVLAFLITFIATPLVARKMGQLGIVGIDIHKEHKPKVPEMGGVAILLGFIVSMLAYFFYHNSTEILIVTIIVLLVGVVGVIDGIKKLSPRQKVISLTAIGILLVPYAIPSFQGYDFGLIYLIALPIFFMFACNFTNMLAGFNGLEIGTGAIAALSIAAIALVEQQTTSFVIVIVIFAALLAFLYYNKFPAKVFPGDVGTLPIGACLFSAAVIGKLEIFAAIVLIPYVLDAALKLASAGIMTRESQAPTQIKDGKLYAPQGSNLSLARLFLREPMAESEVVRRVWAVEALFGAAAVASAWVV